MHFQNLAHVHPRRNPQRVQNNVGWRTVGHVRHVFDRSDPRNDTLVAVTAGHLVAGLQAALDGKVNLDHLQHAGRQLIALRQLLALFFESQIELMALLFDRFLGLLQHHCLSLIGQADVEPLPAVEVGQVGLGRSPRPWPACAGRR